MAGIAEEGREKSWAVEPRQAHPVDGAVATHKSDGFAIPYSGIILDKTGHQTSSGIV
jgi:hypothetical protein